MWRPFAPDAILYHEASRIRIIYSITCTHEDDFNFNISDQLNIEFSTADFELSEANFDFNL